MENKNHVALAAGILAALAIGLSIGALAFRQFAPSSSPASVGDISVVVNGAPVNASAPGGSLSGSYPSGAVSEPRFGASSGTQYTDYASTSLSVATIGGGSSLTKVLHNVYTTNSIAIIDGESATSLVTVSGAAVNSPCFAAGRGNFTGASSSIAITCNVRTTDVVSLTFTAVSSSAANLTSADYDITLFSF